MSKMEKEIEAALRKMVSKHGGKCLKWVCPGWSGVPDRIILLPGGRIVFAEVKRPTGGEMSTLQEWWGEQLSLLGFWCVVIRSMEDIHWLELIIQSEKGSRL